MNIKQIITIGVAGMAMGAMALDNVEVTDVKARQRYPWNGKVDIDFTLDSKPTEPYQMQVEVYDNVGKTNLPVKSVCTEGVSVEANPCMVRTDTRRIVWDAAKDLPNGFKCTNVLVTCRDSRVHAESDRYMIIDVSAGSSAESFPVTYTNCPPPNGWTEEHMTTKIVLRKVPHGTFYMGSQLTDPERADNEDYHQVTLTKPFYIGIFEITDAQYNYVVGEVGGEAKPAEKTWAEIRGHDVVLTAKASGTTWTQDPEPAYSWPTTTEVDKDSFMGKLRAKTGKGYDLPTEAQWEYACGSGSRTALYLGVTNSVEAATLIRGEPVIDKTGTRLLYLGNYLPNALGLYDMNGNVDEWCLDVYAEKLGFESIVNPTGSVEHYETVVLINKGMDMYDTSYDGDAECGGTTVTHVPCYWTLTYNGAGVRRCVRGGGARISTRGSSVSVSYKNPTVTIVQTYPRKGVTRYEDVSYDNPRHGIRLTLPLND